MSREKNNQITTWTIIGVILLPLIWVCLTDVFQVSPRFLPSIKSVVTSWIGLEPNIGVHIAATATRLVIGFILGTALGIGIALMTARYSWLDAASNPTINSMRAVPAAAAVPFFLLWFGFSEIGRYLLATLAVSLNVAIAAREILRHTPVAHDTFFKSFGIAPSSLTIRYVLPRIMEGILPTLRYSLALALGAVTVSELLGAQTGLGYLLQTSRATFSHHLLFFSMIILGLLNVIADYSLRLGWRQLIYWRK